MQFSDFIQLEKKSILSLFQFSSNLYENKTFRLFITIATVSILFLFIHLLYLIFARLALFFLFYDMKDTIYLQDSYD